MKTPPIYLPPIPEGFVYLGTENEIDITGCEDDNIVGIIGSMSRWYGEHAAPTVKWSKEWGTTKASPHWHYIAPRDSKIAKLNCGTTPQKPVFTAGVDFGHGSDKPVVSMFVTKAAYDEMQAERDRWAEAASEQMTQVKRLTEQVKLRDEIIQGIKVALNNVMDF